MGRHAAEPDFPEVQIRSRIATNQERAALKHAIHEFVKWIRDHRATDRDRKQEAQYRREHDRRHQGIALYLIRYGMSVEEVEWAQGRYELVGGSL